MATCNAPDTIFHIRNSNSCLFRRCVLIFPSWLGFCLLFCFLFMSGISSHSIMCIAFILMLHVTFMSYVSTPLLSLSNLALHHHLLLPLLLLLYASEFFPAPLMFIIFIMLVLHALYLSAKYNHFWSCFGWVQKWHKFELNSNLNYFYILKNAQSNLLKFCTNSGLRIYSHISLTPSLLCLRFSLLFSV